MATPTKWTLASDPLLVSNDISMYNEAGNGAGNSEHVVNCFVEPTVSIQCCVSLAASCPLLRRSATWLSISATKGDTTQALKYDGLPVSRR